MSSNTRVHDMSRDRVDTPPSSHEYAKATPVSHQYGPAELNKFTAVLEAVFNILKNKQDNAVSPETPPVPSEKADIRKPLSTGLPLEQPHGVMFKVVDEKWDSRDYSYKVVEQASSAAEDKLDEFAFIVRARFDKKTGNPTHYIDVKSATLRDQLREAMCGVGSSLLLGDKPTIKRNVLFHFVNSLEEYVATSSGDVQALQVLVDYLHAAFSKTWAILNTLSEAQEITYDLMWTMFEPGALIYTKCPGTGAPRCFQFNSIEERMTEQGVLYLRIEGRGFDFDGKVFGESSVVAYQMKFVGAMKIHRLAAFPLQRHRDYAMVRSRMLHSARKFVSLVGCHHRQFRGEAFAVEMAQPVPRYVDGRITVDAAMFFQTNPKYTRPSVEKTRRQEETAFGICIFEGVGQELKVNHNELEPQKLTEDDLLTCSPTVFGFSYSEKLWLEFAVEGISEVVWNKSAWDELVLPQDTKDMLLSLAEVYHDNTFAVRPDVVEGKSQNLNILLHGPPGVGKTLTAEALSEQVEMPLYAISAAEIGTVPERVDEFLHKVFRLSRSWKVLLLLDEADVFLEQRNTENLSRHSIVSVFLRRLEYFKGILVLTTNRVDQFDEAILNRIHIKLNYPKMGPDSRGKVWANNLRNDCKNGLRLTKEEVERLVRTPLNGRQIKNIVYTARVMACRHRKHLELQHLQTAIEATVAFETDFHKTSRSEGFYN